jgi:hypothetical protein
MNMANIKVTIVNSGMCCYGCDVSYGRYYETLGSTFDSVYLLNTTGSECQWDGTFDPTAFGLETNWYDTPLGCTLLGGTDIYRYGYITLTKDYSNIVTLKMWVKESTDPLEDGVILFYGSNYVTCGVECGIANNVVCNNCDNFWGGGAAAIKIYLGP